MSSLGDFCFAVSRVSSNDKKKMPLGIFFDDFFERFKIFYDAFESCLLELECFFPLRIIGLHDLYGERLFRIFDDRVVFSYLRVNLDICFEDEFFEKSLCFLKSVKKISEYIGVYDGVEP